MLAQTLTDQAARLEPFMEIARPPGAGPFPVVLMLHGCGGPRPFQLDAAAQVVRAGGAAVLIDSFAPRRISRIAALATVCTGAQLRGAERAGDLFAILAWTGKQDWADAKRIVAAGWSHGAWTIMDALALRAGEEMRRATGLTDLPREPLEGLAGAFLAYPYAGVASLAGRRDWRIAPPTTAILAGRDFIVGEKTPRAALERQRARGAPIEIVFFPNATHAFEDAEAEDPRIRHDPELTARTYALLCDQLTRA
jgi:dienelactone hydrolase